MEFGNDSIEGLQDLSGSFGMEAGQKQKPESSVLDMGIKSDGVSLDQDEIDEKSISSMFDMLTNENFIEIDTKKMRELFEENVAKIERRQKISRYFIQNEKPERKEFAQIAGIEEDRVCDMIPKLIAKYNVPKEAAYLLYSKKELLSKLMKLEG
jgi:hypothetical protein